MKCFFLTAFFSFLIKMSLVNNHIFQNHILPKENKTRFLDFYSADYVIGTLLFGVTNKVIKRDKKCPNRTVVTKKFDFPVGTEFWGGTPIRRQDCLLWLFWFSDRLPYPKVMRYASLSFSHSTLRYISCLKGKSRYYQRKNNCMLVFMCHLIYFFALRTCHFFFFFIFIYVFIYLHCDQMSKVCYVI